MVATPKDVRPVHLWATTSQCELAAAWNHCHPWQFLKMYVLAHSLASSLGVSLNSLLIHITDILVRTETQWRNGAVAEQRT